MDEITITEWFYDETRTSGRIEFQIRNLTVEVFVSSKFGGPVEAHVNWPAIGSVESSVARDFAALITSAAEWTDEFNTAAAR